MNASTTVFARVPLSFTTKPKETPRRKFNNITVNLQVSFVVIDCVTVTVSVAYVAL